MARKVHGACNRRKYTTAGQRAMKVGIRPDRPGGKEAKVKSFLEIIRDAVWKGDRK